MIAALAVAAACTWNAPGVDPFIGDVVSAVDRYTDIPADVRAAVQCAKKLREAAEALSIYSMACFECHDGSGVQRGDDGRSLLMGDLQEFAGWLESVYGTRS